MWILITLTAAALQIARTSKQHQLRGLLGVAEAGYVRFAYAAPLAVAGTSVWMLGPGEMVMPGARFWISVLLGGVSQILATMALLRSFRLRDFAVGTVYSKTEVLFVGAGSALLLGEPLSWLGWAGVAICLAGVITLATGGAPTATTFKLDPAALYGALAAAGFAGAALGIRSASSSITGSVVDRALLTLTAMLVLQTIIQGTGIALSPGSSLRAVGRAWRQSLTVAALSLSGSAAWALAMTLENAAKVRTLGQVEIVFAFAIGVIVHNENHNQREYYAAAAVTLGILLIVVT